MSYQIAGPQNLRPMQRYSYSWQTRRFNESEYRTLIGTINFSMAALGFALQNYGDYYFVYEKEEKPNPWVAVALALFWLLPAIIYAIFWRQKSVVTIQVFGTEDNFIFSVSGPGYALAELDRIITQFNQIPLNQDVVACKYPFYAYQPSVILNNSETQSCPNCKTQIEEGFKICPNCGRILELKCTDCGRDLKPEWRNCPQCGKELQS